MKHSCEVLEVETPIEQSCPICDEAGSLTMIAHTTEIAYFGEHTQVTLSCAACGWKQSDLIPAEGGKPGAWSLPIKCEADLAIRVVRGSSCTVRIPELDLEVKPGTHSSGYVSNVEGVLERFQNIVEMVLRQLEGSAVDEISQCVAMLAALTGARSGIFDSELTIELLDPRGHSQILHGDVVSRALSESELDELAFGPDPSVFELDQGRN